jgi:large subunit ribosomal protein L6
MSRVGKNPIAVPAGVSVDIRAEELVIKGGKGELATPVPPGISFALEDSTLTADRANEEKQTRAYHGLARALAANAVTGVSEGFKRELEIHGVGYRAAMQGKTLTLQLGFSHPVEFAVPEGLQITTPDQTHIVIEGIDKQLVGETAAQIRRLRPPDAYKGKGVRYSDEIVRTKVGKTGAGAV